MQMMEHHRRARDGGGGNAWRRERRTSTEVVKECAAAEESGDELEDRGVERSKRECPVPKPGGLVGEILGFKGSSSDGKGARPP